MGVVKARLGSVLKSGILVAVTTLALAATAAQASTETLASSTTNSFCIHPTSSAFKAENTKHEVNTAPITKGTSANPFPETGNACGEPTVIHPELITSPPWTGTIPGASWVGLDAFGEDHDLGDTYYIYNATFQLCDSQRASTTIAGTMLSDNQAGAFLNGQPIGHQFNGTPINWAGPATAFGAGATRFKAGLNVLQFVVLNEGLYTGLDFKAVVTKGTECVPHWLGKGNVPLKEGERVAVSTAGGLYSTVNGTVIKCRLIDQETIENPIGGGAGVDEMTAFTLSPCKAYPALCPRNSILSVIAGNLPWQTLLGAEPDLTIRDLIGVIALSVYCDNTLLDTFTGVLAPKMNNGTLEFTAGSGFLEDPFGTQYPVSGKDKLTGPVGRPYVTAG
jgi:hypothetical protein